MTRFDAADFQQQNQSADAALLSGAKFSADYQNMVATGNDVKFVKVADQAPAAAGDGQQQQQGPEIGVKALLAVDPKELTPNLKTLQGLAAHFDKGTDKAKAMAEVKPEVVKEIAASDAALVAASKAAETEAATLKPQYEAAAAKVQAAQGPFQDAAKKVPEADRKRVQAELGLLFDDKTSPAVKRALETDLNSHYKGLVPAAKAYGDAQQAALPILQKAQELQGKMEEAAQEPIVSRLIYADMQEQSGDHAGAKQTQAEAMALQMGMTIEQFRQLQQQQKGGTGTPKP